jgi:hypothetical protein
MKQNRFWFTLSFGCLLFLSINFETQLSRNVRAEELFSKWETAGEISAKTGKNRVLIPAGRHGLNYFPDQPICILKEQPLAFLLVANGTYVMQGQSFETAVPVGQVLKPGPMGSFDNNYAGIGGIYNDKARNRVIGFYHAEDKEGLGVIEANGVQGFYATIGAAEASMHDHAFRKLGAAISADKPKLTQGRATDGSPKESWLAQGVGDPTVCIDATGKYLLCYYVEWSNRQKRGVQICVARCPIETAGLPGAWQKYYQGAFSQPGLGGHDTPVVFAGLGADAYTPQVQYVREWERYVMVFGIGVASEINARPLKPVQSGLYISTSKDGIKWGKPFQIDRVFSLVINTQECKVHPTLVISRTTKDKLTGQLLYGYTPRWPESPHHLGSCPITIELEKSENNLKSHLAGTKWINSNDVTFEWTTDGRLLHSGIKREWRVLNESQVEIVFGSEHKDILVFDEEMKTFTQFIKGGPSSFTGKRQ